MTERRAREYGESGTTLSCKPTDHKHRLDLYYSTVTTVITIHTKCRARYKNTLIHGSKAKTTTTKRGELHDLQGYSRDEGNPKYFACSTVIWLVLPCACVVFNQNREEEEKKRPRRTFRYTFPSEVQHTYSSRLQNSRHERPVSLAISTFTYHSTEQKIVQLGKHE
jgi:hypothetical protein